MIIVSGFNGYDEPIDALLGNEDDALLLQVALDDLETVNGDLGLSCDYGNSIICSNTEEHQNVFNDQNDHAYCSSENDSQNPQQNQGTAAEPVAADVTTNHGDVDAQVNQAERVLDIEAQRALEAPTEEVEAPREEDEAQRMMEALVDFINHHEEVVSLENLLGAVNVNNMDDYLSVYHVQQQQQPDHHDNNSVWQAANNMPHQAPVAGVIEERDDQRPHPGNVDDDLIVVIENHLDDVIDYHDNLVVDVDDDANRRVVVHQNDNIILDHDVMREAVVADHHGDEAVFDLDELLDGAADVPRLDLAVAEDPAFDAGMLTQFGPRSSRGPCV